MRYWRGYLFLSFRYPEASSLHTHTHTGILLLHCAIPIRRRRAFTIRVVLQQQQQRFVCALKCVCAGVLCLFGLFFSSSAALAGPFAEPGRQAERDSEGGTEREGEVVGGRGEGEESERERDKVDLCFVVLLVMSRVLHCLFLS